MAYRYRVVETKDQDEHPLWSIRAVEHDADGTPVSVSDFAVVMALHDDGMAPADSLRQQLQEQMAALDEPIVDADALPVA